MTVGCVRIPDSRHGSILQPHADGFIRITSGLYLHGGSAELQEQGFVKEGPNTLHEFTEALLLRLLRRRRMRRSRQRRSSRSARASCRRASKICESGVSRWSSYPALTVTFLQGHVAELIQTLKLNPKPKQIPSRGTYSGLRGKTDVSLFEEWYLPALPLRQKGLEHLNYPYKKPLHTTRPVRPV
jgi:hypothetical protein